METALLTDRLAEIEKEVKKEKIILPEEISTALRDLVAFLQKKIELGQAVTQKDLYELGRIKEWIALPDFWRKKYQHLSEIEPYIKKAKERGISITQWLDCWHIMDTLDKYPRLIDETFEFPGNGTIRCRKLSLMSRFAPEILRLPDHLKVEEDLNMTGCEKMLSLPKGLEAKKLDLSGCKALTSLPDDLTVKESLIIHRCTSLKTLPNHFRCAAVFIDQDLPKSLQDKAWELANKAHFGLSYG